MNMVATDRATLETIAQCCGNECRFKAYPIARVMLCGLEITKEDQDAAKEAFVKYKLEEESCVRP